MILSKRGDNKLVFFVFLFLVLTFSLIAIATNDTSGNQTNGEVQGDVLFKNEIVKSNETNTCNLTANGSKYEM